MKGKFSFISSIFEIVIGILGTVSFIVLLINDEPIGKWIIAFVFSIILIIVGVLGIINYCKK